MERNAKNYYYLIIRGEKFSEYGKKIITRIEADPKKKAANAELSILRTAAYCRVSTDSSDQLESYKEQVAYYTDAIAKNPKWRFTGIYADKEIIYGEQY